MKQWLIALLLFGGAFRTATAAETSNSDEKCLSVCVSGRTECDNPLAVYELYATYYDSFFIKLDTRNGKIWLIESSPYTKAKRRREKPINAQSLVPNDETEEKGRFVLQPNAALDSFVLLDRISGKIWQLTWFNGFDFDTELIPIHPD